MYNATYQTDVSYRCNEHLTREHDMPSTFGKRLLELLEAREPKLTQKEFAAIFTQFMQSNKAPDDKRKHSYSQQQISNYVKGKAKPDIDVIIGAADFFFVSPLYMAGVTDDPNVEVEEAKLKPEERYVLVQMRINNLFRKMVLELAKFSAGAADPRAPQEGKDQLQLPSSTEATQS